MVVTVNPVKGEALHSDLVLGIGRLPIGLFFRCRDEIVTVRA
jgi:hypothetical protein